jgi:hypothetical protein
MFDRQLIKCEQEKKRTKEKKKKEEEENDDGRKGKKDFLGKSEISNTLR